MELISFLKSLCLQYQAHNTAALFLIAGILVRTDKKQALLHNNHKNDIDRNKEDISKVSKKTDANTKEITSINIRLAEKFTGSYHIAKEEKSKT